MMSGRFMLFRFVADATTSGGESFTRKWSDAHEYRTRPEDVSGNVVMDIHNNDVGIEIGKNNPNATPEELKKIILDRISKGDLIILDNEGNLRKSDGSTLKFSEIRQYEKAKKIAEEILKNQSNQNIKEYGE